VKLPRSSDAILAVVVVAITAMLLVTIPTALLDLLIVASISVSLLLLAVALYVPNALSLLTFPSLLLLTTLFRLSLNVASTRLILLQGYAGDVIQSFGLFLVQGDVIVGIIIFSIITVVNFVVIARGASRVAEVAARFTLDALPGKQMAIEADMRAGLISTQQAAARRDELRKESQLYGNMDGAMRFVQGDVIAGIFIIFVNVIGGIYLGVSRGATFADALSTYTILTVGDGLVTQIPALLISVCAAIVVTRISSNADSTLGSDVSAQLFNRPAALFLAGGTLILIGFLPELPTTPFWIIGAGFLFYGWHNLKSRRALVASPAGSLPFVPGVSTPATLLLGRDLERDTAVAISSESPAAIIAVDSQLLYKLFELNRERYQIWWEALRAEFDQRVGVRLPNLRIVPEDGMEASSYIIRVSGGIVDRGVLPLDAVLLEMNPDSAIEFGIEPIAESSHPLWGTQVFWAVRSPRVRRVIEAAGVRHYDVFEYLGLKLAAFFRANPEEILTLGRVQEMLRILDEKSPGLREELFADRLLDAPRLTEVLQQLVREGVSISPLDRILEAASLYVSRERGRARSGEAELDLDELFSTIRLAKRRQITSDLLSSTGALRVIVLAEDIERTFEELMARGALAEWLGGSRAQLETLHRTILEAHEPLRRRALPPIVLLCKSSLRRSVVQLLQHFQVPVPVMATEELESATRVEIVGLWRA